MKGAEFIDKTKSDIFEAFSKIADWVKAVSVCIV